MYFSFIFKGLLLSFLSGVFYSLSAVVVKFMNNIHPGQLAIYRAIGILVFALPQAVQTQDLIFGPREQRFLLFLRSVFGATTTFLNFLAFRYLPLGEAAVIIFSVPIFVTIAARILLKESCGIVQTIISMITVVGVILSINVPQTLLGKSFDYSSEHIYGLVTAFSSLICNTFRLIVIRKLRNVHHSVINFNFGWMSIFESAILTVLIGNFSFPDCGVQQGLVVLLGVLGYLGVTFLTMALRIENAGPTSTMRAASDIILAFVWQSFFFNNVPDGFGIAGAVLVGLSIVLLGLSKWISSLPSDSAASKYLGFLTA